MRAGGYIRSVKRVPSRSAGPPDFSAKIPALACLEELELSPQITFLVGENGSGKSTLIEAIAILAGFNPEGGSMNFKFANRPSESAFHNNLQLVRSTTRPRDGFFFRAESF